MTDFLMVFGGIVYFVLWIFSTGLFLEDMYGQNDVLRLLWRFFLGLIFPVSIPIFLIYILVKQRVK